VVSPPASPAPGRTWPFTGRDAELRAVEEALDRDGAVSTARRVAVVAGGRLAEELLARHTAVRQGDRDQHPRLARATCRACTRLGLRDRTALVAAVVPARRG
jgi:hypothetical protein